MPLRHHNDYISSQHKHFSSQCSENVSRRHPMVITKLGVTDVERMMVLAQFALYLVIQYMKG